MSTFYLTPFSRKERLFDDILIISLISASMVERIIHQQNPSMIPATVSH